MKKSSLTTAVLAGIAGLVGFAGSANAVELNPDGTGQVLIYPYYTVNSGQQTIVSVVNSTAVGKAVKVRFLEGYNSQEVLDFNLFLSPFDVWTANVFAMDDAGLGSVGAAVGTSDNSCTVPTFASQPVVSGLHYAAFSDRLFGDGGPTTIDRTREGYIELITMADVVGPTLGSITHGGGMPADCGDTALRDPANPDFIAPGGGLFGAGTVIDVADGVMYPYVADAIDGFTDRPLFSDSGSVTPTLAFANTAPAGAVAHIFEGGGSLLTLTYPAGQEIDAVSAVFQASALLNEWVSDSASGYGTDWVVTFPTKRFYVNGAAAIQPFVALFGEPGQSCTLIGASLYDREEYSFTPAGDIFSPPPEDQPGSSLCHEVNVITISSADAPESVLGSNLDVNIAPPEYGPGSSATSGWMRLNLNPAGETHALRADASGTTLFGLPATGFQASRFINGNVGGVLSNYAGAYRHRVERSVSTIP